MRMGSGWRATAGYGALLAGGTALLQWLDYARLVRERWDDLFVFLVAALFLCVGLAAGSRLAPRRAAAPPGNPQAQAALGISARELAVLGELAAGRSNKEIAARLAVSPNTVKTHVARLFAKLEARRRTEAIARARDLGLVP